MEYVGDVCCCTVASLTLQALLRGQELMTTCAWLGKCCQETSLNRCDDSGQRGAPRGTATGMETVSHLL